MRKNGKPEHVLKLRTEESFRELLNKIRQEYDEGATLFGRRFGISQNHMLRVLNGRYTIPDAVLEHFGYVRRFVKLDPKRFRVDKSEEYYRDGRSKSGPALRKRSKEKLQDIEEKKRKLKKKLKESMRSKDD